MPKLVRLTLFKISEAELVKQAVDKYSTMAQDATKDDEPYIKVAAAHPTYDDPRNDGVTVVARTVFESKEDMDFFDSSCSAHGRIKALLKDKLDGPPVVLYMDA